MRRRSASFSALLLAALDRVPSRYYKVAEFFPPGEVGRELKRLVAGNPTMSRAVSRHSERVFCYELYHQLRLAIERAPFLEPHLLERVVLQAELIKPRKEWLEHLIEGVIPLAANYIPDFLIHEPGTFHNQIVVMEVKSAAAATFGTFRSDLGKLDQFVDRYLYKEAIMLVVNTPSERMDRIFRRQSTHNWLHEHISHGDAITIVAKEAPQVPPWSKTVSEALRTLG